jgi:hypothetical protein
MKNKKGLISGGCLILSIILLAFSCWLITLIFSLPTLTLLQGM